MSKNKKPEINMNDQSSKARRKLVKTAIIGTGAASVIPGKWAKPVIDSVILPAHALTTSDSDSEAGANTTAAPTTTKQMKTSKVNYDDLDYDIV